MMVMNDLIQGRPTLHFSQWAADETINSSYLSSVWWFSEHLAAHSELLTTITVVVLESQLFVCANLNMYTGESLFEPSFKPSLFSCFIGSLLDYFLLRLHPSFLPPHCSLSSPSSHLLVLRRATCLITIVNSDNEYFSFIHSLLSSWNISSGMDKVVPSLPLSATWWQSQNTAAFSWPPCWCAWTGYICICGCGLLL